jgi:hypothetical protein
MAGDHGPSTQMALFCNPLTRTIRSEKQDANAIATVGARTLVKANAFAHCGSRFQRAQIVVYALGGLMLEGTFGLIKHDPIQVELIMGTRVPGKIAWSLGAHTGMILQEPLQPSHPLVELERRARRALS